MVSSDFDNSKRTGLIVLRPNHSWTWRANLYFLATLSVLSISVAVAFLLQGFWLILPFAGLELLVLSVALYLVVRQSWRQEVLRFSEEAVVVESGIGRIQERHCFERFFTRIHVLAPRSGWHPRRIHLAQREQELEIGAFLNDADKDLLIAELRRMVNVLNG